MSTVPIGGGALSGPGRTGIAVEADPGPAARLVEDVVGMGVGERGVDPVEPIVDRSPDGRLDCGYPCRALDPAPEFEGDSVIGELADAHRRCRGLL